MMFRVCLIFLLLVGYSLSAQDLKDSDFLKIRSAVFEVVRPFSLEFKNIQYDTKINYSQLPHAIRNKKYQSFGTAFAIDKKTIVSAAHVFDLHLKKTFLKDIRLRDKNDNLYEIDQVLQYDQRKDYIVFNLKSYPKDMQFLDVSEKSKVGQTVFSIGNALGQGVVERKGRITSYTDEEYKGDFKYIRFTAPASPGNSGGPLVDLNAKVVGIVIGKSANENLNYSVPIELLKKDKTKMAQFYDRKLVESDDAEEFFSVWEYKEKLPQKFLAFSDKSSQAYLNGIVERRKVFEDKFKNNIFPHDKTLKPLLHAQRTGAWFLELKKTEAKEWIIADYKDFESLEYSKGKNIIYKVAGNSYQDIRGEVYVDKPDNLSLEQFIQKPKLYFDIILKTLRPYVTVAEQKLHIVSVGEPMQTDQWQDSYGRNWTSSAFLIEPFEAVIHTHCLPIPKGVTCELRSNPYWLSDLELFYYKIKAPKLVLGYYGDLNNWDDFLALPKNMLPKSLSALKINRKKPASIEDLSGNLKLVMPFALDENATIDIGNSHALDLSQEKIAVIMVDPKKDNTPSVYVKRMYEPHPENKKEDKEGLQKVFARKGGDDGQVHVDEDGYYQRLLIDEKANPKSILRYQCYLTRAKSKKSFKKSCDKILQLNQ
ncbi:MAG TPA: serine protease [Oligoflexia bacterium]|nr:serine protease [Oligoflexia bacterium]HMR24361.1 serine protease [Oligoflexia bacterium]